MSLADWSDILDICNIQPNISLNKRIKNRGITLKHLLKWKKEAVEDIDVLDDSPYKIEDQLVLQR
jgi:hypothetical protein